MDIERLLHLIARWLVNHGFQLSNREWASLILLTFLVIGIIVFAAVNTKFRHQLADLFRIAFFSKLAYIWIIYIVWIGLFVYSADYFGYWQPRLTKATIVWAGTAGITFFVGSVEAQSLGYFKSAVKNLFRGVIVIEYFLGISSFSILIEIILQLIIIVVTVILTIDTGSQRDQDYLGNSLLILLFVVMTINSALAIPNAWTELDKEWILKQLTLPILLLSWVLLLALPFSMFSAYENVFVKLRIFRVKESGMWKVKLGVILALRHHLKAIREAEKGGAEITRAARADTVRESYREARKLVDE